MSAEQRPSLGIIIGRLLTGARIPFGAPSNPLVDSHIIGVDDITPDHTRKGSRLPKSYIYPFYRKEIIKK